MRGRDAVLDLLGLAARAAIIATGTERVRESVVGGSARYVIVAEDASANTIDKLIPLLERRGVPYAQRYSRMEIGNAVGRSPLSAVAVSDAGMARRIRTLMTERDGEHPSKAPAGERRQA